MITKEEFVSELLGSSKKTKNKSLKENKTLRAFCFQLRAFHVLILPEDEYVS
jgi:hypothetical protein